MPKSTYELLAKKLDANVAASKTLADGKDYPIDARDVFAAQFRHMLKAYVFSAHPDKYEEYKKTFQEKNTTAQRRAEMLWLLEHAKDAVAVQVNLPL